MTNKKLKPYREIKVETRACFWTPKDDKSVRFPVVKTFAKERMRPQNITKK